MSNIVNEAGLRSSLLASLEEKNNEPVYSTTANQLYSVGCKVKTEVQPLSNPRWNSTVIYKLPRLGNLRKLALRMAHSGGITGSGGISFYKSGGLGCAYWNRAELKTSDGRVLQRFLPISTYQSLKKGPAAWRTAMASALSDSAAVSQAASTSYVNVYAHLVDFFGAKGDSSVCDTITWDNMELHVEMDDVS